MQIVAAARPLRWLVAQAIVAAGADSACHCADGRRHFQLFAGARTVDAPARTPFVRPGHPDAAKTDGADAGMDRAQMDRASTRKSRATTGRLNALRFVFYRDYPTV